MKKVWRRLNLGVSGILLLASCLVNPVWAVEPRLITQMDLLDFTWLADPQISPDGSRIVYLQVTADRKKDGYQTALWLASTAGGPPRPLTGGGRDSTPRWSPDGRQIAFLRVAEKDGKPTAAQVYLLSLDGGEAQALTDLPEGVGAPVWSPDGRQIAFTSGTLPEDLDEKKEKPEHESDVRVVTQAIYRFDNGGYLDFSRKDHLWTVQLPATPSTKVKPKPITTGKFDEGMLRWSPDGTKIYFLTDRASEPSYHEPDTDLYAISAQGGPITKVVDIDGPVGNYTLSPDGKRVAFVGFLNHKPTRSYNQTDLFVADLTPGAAVKNLTAAYDYDITDNLSADQHSPRGGQPADPVWSQDGRFVYIVGSEKGTANLKRIDAETGQVAPFTQGDQEVLSYTATPDASKMALIVTSPTNINDLYLTSNGDLTQRTQVNKPLFDRLQISTPEAITYPSFDGQLIQAWVLKPPGFDPKKKYPLILNIHGGPHIAYGYTFFHEFQWMAAKGYVVLYPNPRGSTTYGQDFGNIIQYRYPGDDYKDLMAGVDYLLGQGYIDAKRLGVTGGSGGGLLTNWTITQTNRFQAAVSQRSIADWASWWYSADFTLFQPSWFRGAPFQETANFAARSPITYIDKVQTPLMLIEGEADYRTPSGSGGETMFRALKYLKKPTAMVRFPGESHELSRSGKPWHRVERLEHIVNWFDKYLLGKKIDRYDVP
ncbi:S9 family peptidase [Anthocerotibacter panamensis]|uniref:S9 family peptidase n=1 Tax=Anthocerotibacter panamensis TaxID=2857077 RepID=UPI001C406B0B|nr:S9 family peptidase [Anthocerotibacter panamensis]